MVDSDLRYYILFENYEHGLALKDILTSDGVKCRIAPAPRAIQGKLSCGMSLLLEPEWLEPAKASIAAHNAVYHDIVPLAGQLRRNRDQYC